VVLERRVVADGGVVVEEECWGRCWDEGLEEEVEGLDFGIPILWFLSNFSTRDYNSLQTNGCNLKEEIKQVRLYLK